MIQLKSKSVTYEGKRYPSMAEFCRVTGHNYTNVAVQMRRYGNLDKLGCKSRPLSYMGKPTRVADLVRKFGYKQATMSAIARRFDYNLPHHSLWQKDHSVVYLGVKYDSCKDMERKTGIGAHRIRKHLKEFGTLTDFNPNIKRGKDTIYDGKVWNRSDLMVKLGVSRQRIEQLVRKFNNNIPAKGHRMRKSHFDRKIDILLDEFKLSSVDELGGMDVNDLICVPSVGRGTIKVLEDMGLKFADRKKQ